MTRALGDRGGARPGAPRPRADAERNLQALLAAAKEMFAQGGVEAPVRAIAERAGVGIGTLYRHFPRRADLVAAVFQAEIDACADAAEDFSTELPPFEALAAWMGRFVELAATKRGLAGALGSGDPAFAHLPARREQRLRPAYRALFAAALASGGIRTDITADEFLNAVAGLCSSADPARPEAAKRLVDLLVRGLRSEGAPQP